MDPKHLKLVESSIPKLPRGMEVGDLSKMKAIKENLKCKSFQWYLDTVYPELFFPDTENFVWMGSIKHIDDNKCIDTMNKNKEGADLGMYPCHGQGGTQYFAGSKSNEIRVPGVGWEYCVDGNGGRVFQPVILYKCHGGGGAQHWEYHKKTKQLKVVSLCLTYEGNQNATLQPCSADNRSQMWEILDSKTNTTLSGF